VLPIVIAPAVSGLAPLARFAANAPIAIPGHTRAPQMSTAATAIPVGGQTAVTLRLSKASRKPSRAPR
jgi:hypothetical protein